MSTRTGTVYLLHFDQPYRHARHYLGWARDVDARLAAHQAGHGARLLAVIQTAGISWTLARTWTGTRHRERQLKRMGGASRRCPLCGVRPKPDRDPIDHRPEQVIRRQFHELTYAALACTDPADQARLYAECDRLCGLLPAPTGPTITDLIRPRHSAPALTQEAA